MGVSTLLGTLGPTGEAEAGPPRPKTLHSGCDVGVSRTDVAPVANVDGGGVEKGAEAGVESGAENGGDCVAGAAAGEAAGAAAGEAAGAATGAATGTDTPLPACSRSSLMPLARWKRRPKATISISFKRLMSMASSASPLISCSASFSIVGWS